MSAPESQTFTTPAGAPAAALVCLPDVPRDRPSAGAPAVQPVQTVRGGPGDGPDERWRRAVAGWLLGYPSAATRREYARDIRDWTAWCWGLGVDPLAAGRDHVAAWQRTLHTQYAPATVARRIAALAALYAYLVDEEIIRRSPVRGRRPRTSGETTVSTGLTEQEAARLLDAAAASSVRDTCLIGLLYFLGLRVSEALSARVQDLGWERGFRTVTVVRKGGQRQRLPVPPGLAHTVEILVGDRTSGTIIATRSGRPVDRKAAWTTVRRLARAARLPAAATAHPHDLRHGFATAALDAGTPLRDVQDAMGHADPRTTRRYDRARGQIDRHPGSVLATRLAAYQTAEQHPAGSEHRTS